MKYLVVWSGKISNRENERFHLYWNGENWTETKNHARAFVTLTAAYQFLTNKKYCSILIDDYEDIYYVMEVEA